MRNTDRWETSSLVDDMSSSATPRVLFCTDTYPPQMNGVSVVTALSVAGLRERGWQCAVIAPRYPASTVNAFTDVPATDALDRQLTSIPSLPFPLYPDIRLAAPAWRTVARTIRDFRPHLVHCETEFTIGRLGQIAAARAGIPFTTSYHTDFSRYTAAYGVPRLRSMVSGYLGRFHRRAVRTYTPSEPARQDLLAMGVRDVEVWGRGVDSTLYAPSKRSTALRDAYGFGKAFTFVHVGRLAAEKGVERIVDAFRMASQGAPDGTMHLVIAGTGPCESALRARAPRHVTFLGHLDRKSFLPKLYASGDAFVFSSLTETLGLVVLEAMASGLPVIATPAGGVADHLRDGINGIAYPPADVHALAKAMLRLVFDRPLAARLGRGARITAKALTWASQLDQLDQSYRTLCRWRPLSRALIPAPLSAPTYPGHQIVGM